MSCPKIHLSYNVIIFSSRVLKLTFMYILSQRFMNLCYMSNSLSYIMYLLYIFINDRPHKFRPYTLVTNLNDSFSRHKYPFKIIISMLFPFIFVNDHPSKFHDQTLKSKILCHVIKYPFIYIISISFLSFYVKSPLCMTIYHEGL